MNTIVFYVSGHGLGHASRDIEVINELLSRHEDLQVIVRTAAPRWLFERTVTGLKLVHEGPGFSPAVHVHHIETDTGIMQIDSLHLDAEESVRRAREFMRRFDQRVSDEARFLSDAHASLVIADIPPLGIVAGAAAAVPTVGLGNFTWDWIYAAYPGTRDLCAAIGDAYARADVGLRLPMSGGFGTFGRVIDLPFVARRSRREPHDTRYALRLPLHDRLVLVSFGGYGLAGLDLDALSRLEGYVALVSGGMPLADLPRGLRGGRRGSLLPFDESAMYEAGFRYEDLVRAVDVVVTKPGYGIIAECLANETALLYTSRGHFIEYDVLVAAMPRFVRAAFIDHADLFAGRWASHLDRLMAQPPPPERPAVNGAEVAADTFLAMT